MISFENISFSVAGQTLVKNSTVSIPSGHKVGLVGKNGTGKTSLFRLIYGEITLDQGNLKLNKKLNFCLKEFVQIKYYPASSEKRFST